MKLYIDYRERKIRRLFETFFDNFELLQLPLGDYILSLNDDAIVIERKTIGDFISSIRSNRLWDQLLRLLKAEEVLGYKIKRRILLIQGNFESYLNFNETYSPKNLSIFWSQLMGAFMEILYVYDTPLIFTEDDVALMAFFKTLIKREEKGMNDKLPSARWYRTPARADLPTKDRKAYIISSFPMIGNQLAQNLLDHFGTIVAIANASKKELQRVPKIGKKKAEIIHKIFHS
jgi:ERCC4-type nuclease